MQKWSKMKKYNKEKMILNIPIYCLDAIWRGTFKTLPANKKYELTIDYPLSSPAKYIIKTGKGMNFIGLLKEIGKAYIKVYADDDKNDSKYGIWGHEITDLALEGISIDHKKKTIKLDIGS